MKGILFHLNLYHSYIYMYICEKHFISYAKQRKINIANLINKWTVADFTFFIVFLTYFGQIHVA